MPLVGHSSSRGGREAPEAPEADYRCLPWMWMPQCRWWNSGLRLGRPSAAAKKQRAEARSGLRAEDARHPALPAAGRQCRTAGKDGASRSRYRQDGRGLGLRAGRTAPKHPCPGLEASSQGWRNRPSKRRHGVPGPTGALHGKPRVLFGPVYIRVVHGKVKPGAQTSSVSWNSFEAAHSAPSSA
uniref:Uncharacterized protein n=1 Tax=Xiphophorus maculatus TaxID=8083 RepID=A0A3B5QFC4_XIPMA